MLSEKTGICGKIFHLANPLLVWYARYTLPKFDYFKALNRIVSVLHQNEKGNGKSRWSREISRVKGSLEGWGKSQGSREISRAEGIDFSIPPKFWWSVDILSSSIFTDFTELDRTVKIRLWNGVNRWTHPLFRKSQYPIFSEIVPKMVRKLVNLCIG